MYRTVYVATAALLMHLKVISWEPLMTGFGPLWDISGNRWSLGVTMALALCAFLWLVSATFAIDHFDLFGIKQGTGLDIYKKLGLAIGDTFSARLHHQLVRHPIYLGFLLIFFLTPIMTLNHLLFSLVSTIYIILATKFLEEPDLLEKHPEYAEYVKAGACCPLFSKHN